MGWLGCSLSSLLLSIKTNGVYLIASLSALYAHKRKVSSFFLIFFSWGVGAWVWARGCGRVGVGAWVWVLGCGRVGVGVGGGDGGGLDGAG